MCVDIYAVMTKESHVSWFYSGNCVSLAALYLHVALFSGYVYIRTWKEVVLGCTRRGKENRSTSGAVIG